MNTYLTEFIGTFFLVLTIGLSVLGGTPMAPLAIGAVLMVMVCMGGHVSGGHYNPAVSLAVWLRGKLEGREVVPYMAAQVLGAVAAAAVVYVVLGQTFAPAPAQTASAVAALLVEVLYTGALCLVVLHSATAPQTTGNSFYGLAIGFTVVVAAFAGGPILGWGVQPRGWHWADSRLGGARKQRPGGQPVALPPGAVRRRRFSSCGVPRATACRGDAAEALAAARADFDEAVPSSRRRTPA